MICRFVLILAGLTPETASDRCRLATIGSECIEVGARWKTGAGSRISRRANSEARSSSALPDRLPRHRRTPFGVPQCPPSRPQHGAIGSFRPPRSPRRSQPCPHHAGRHPPESSWWRLRSRGATPASWHPIHDSLSRGFGGQRRLPPLSPGRSAPSPNPSAPTSALRPWIARRGVLGGGQGRQPETGGGLSQDQRRQCR